MESNALRARPQHALAAYAESFAAGARIALFGDSSAGLAERFLALGARAVHVWDPDAARARVEGTNSSIVVQSYAAYESPARVIDVAVVAELGLFADGPALLARVRSLVGDDGIALVSAANVECDHDAAIRAYDYYELFDLVAAEFAGVRMVAQLPFHGMTFVALGGEELSSVSVDTQLAGDRAPLYFVALASAQETDLLSEPYAIIELPADEVEGRSEPSASALRRELDDAVRRGADLAVELRNQGDRCVALESQLAARLREVAELSSEVEEARAIAEAGRMAAAEVEDITRRADRSREQARSLEREIGVAAESSAAELLRFEEALRERAQTVRLLEAELTRRERIIRELVGTIDDADAARGATARAPGPAGLEPSGPGEVNARADRDGGGERGEAGEAGDSSEGPAGLLEDNRLLRGRLDALALELARRESEAQATAWTLAELERRVALAGTEGATTFAVEAPRPSSAVHDELDVLRQALAQEHALRLRLESGEALADARAEIERLRLRLDEAAQDAVAEAAHPPPPLGG
ncbi:MAG: hypothetical protein ABSC94_02420 [Polyangiaceae bacterium]|jgi:hypothetical protein